MRNKLLLISLYKMIFYIDFFDEQTET